MAQNGIPLDIRESAQRIVEHFNRTYPRGSVRYVARFKGVYLYLHREDFGGPPAAICRLQYRAIGQWRFAIFKHSSNRYDPDEFMFPGAALLDGTLEGAMRCGIEAYPP